MKHKTSLMWMAIIAGFTFLPTIDNNRTKLGQAVENINKKLNHTFTELNEKFATTGIINQNTVSSNSDSTDEETPIESNVQGKTLSNTYYYHYEDNVSQAVKNQFNQAVKIYNKTGIVKLVKGQGTSEQNQIEFSVYEKNMESSALQTSIELGHGGPSVIQRTGWGAYTANHAIASLNIKYSNSIKLSVAVHELGHALGLDHSQDLNSVMYPTDQGKTELTTADLNGLRAIYAN